MRTGSRYSNGYGSSRRASIFSSTPSTCSNWMAKINHNNGERREFALRADGPNGFCWGRDLEGAIRN